MTEEHRKRKRDAPTETVTPVAAVSPPDAPTRPTDELEQPEQKRQTQRRSLFVRGLAADTTTDSLIAHFSTDYPIKHGHAVVNGSTKECKGYGFISFADAEDAQRALADLDGSELLGRKIRLEIAEPRKREVDDTLPGELRGKSGPNTTAAELREKRRARVSGDDVKQQAPKLIVRNLPWSIKEPDQLAKLFMSYGKIQYATLPKKGPKTLAGFGFVMLRGHKNATKAIEGVNGKEVDGRKLAVDWAVQKSVWENLAKNEEAEEEQNDKEVEGDGIDDVAEVGQAVDDEEGSEADEEEDGATDDGVTLDKDDVDENSSIELDAGEDEKHIPNGTTDPDDPTTFDAEDRSATLFVRNVAFTTTDDDLYQHFRRLAPVRYARTVTDPTTERPRGTAFVAFRTAADAHNILKNAPRDTRPAPSARDARAPHSLLQDEAADPGGAYTLAGRVLHLAPAVTRSTAFTLAEASSARRASDKRRLYLLSEGTIGEGSALHAQLPPGEAAMRAASLAQRKAQLQKNPSLHLSLTRLSVRNVPRSVDSAALKALARSAVVGFATDVRAGTRAALTREELARGADDMAAAERARKQAGRGIVRQAKVVFESEAGGKVAEKSGGGRSRGYGFVEYHTHRAALMGLRWLNGHLVGASKGADGGEKQKRLIVEFAIENAQVVQRREEREKKARERPAGDAKGAADANGKGKNAKSWKEMRLANKAAAAAEKAAAAKKAKPSAGEKDDELAKRQRIIQKKRSLRRAKRRGT